MEALKINRENYLNQISQKKSLTSTFHLSRESLFAWFEFFFITGPTNMGILSCGEMNADGFRAWDKNDIQEITDCFWNYFYQYDPEGF